MKRGLLTISIIVAAFLMFLPIEVHAQDTAKLVYRSAVWDSETGLFYEDLNVIAKDSFYGEISSTGYTPVYLYFVDENGKESRLDADDVVSANSDICHVENDSGKGVVCLYPKSFGSTSLNYTYNGTVYSLPVTVDLALVDFYSSPVATKESYISEYTVTDEGTNKIYLVCKEGTFSSVALNEDFSQIATLQVSEDNTYAEITIWGEPEDTTDYYRYQIEYETSSSRGLPRIKLINHKSSLRYSWPKWQDGVPSAGDYTGKEMSLSKGNITEIYTFFVKGENKTSLVAGSLYSSDESIIRIKAHENYPDMVTVEAVDFGEAQILYEHTDGKIYSIKVMVELPYVGYYTTTTATEESYITKKILTDEGTNKFYLVCSEGVVLNNVVTNETFAAIATIQISDDKKYAEITIAEDAWGQGNYYLEANITRANGAYTYSTYPEIELVNHKTALLYSNVFETYGEEGELELTEMDWRDVKCNSVIDGRRIMYVYFTSGGNEQRINPNRLISSDESVVRISADEEYPDLVILDLIGFGEATISYEHTDGEIYSIKVMVELPEVGFYTTPTASEDSYIAKYVVKDGKDNKFYLAEKNGKKINSIELYDDFVNIAAVQMGSDGTYAEITVTGIPKNEWYLVNAEVSGYTYSLWRVIYLENGNSVEEVAVTDFVTRMYQQCLSRDPDQAGLDGWVGQLRGGYMNGAQIAEQFVFSNEMLSKNLSDEEFVNVLYRAMMGREADEAGRAGWVNQLSNGYMTRSEVTKAFVESTEFSEICSSYGITRGTYNASIAPIEHFVTRFYTLCLERKPDQAGLYGWVNNLKNQYMNGAQIAEQFFFSDEFVARNVSDEKYIELLYNTLMGRPSDENGKTGWLGQLQNGNMTRRDMMKAFIESNEFTGICESYGITRGTVE